MTVREQADAAGKHAVEAPGMTAVNASTPAEVPDRLVAGGMASLPGMLGRSDAGSRRRATRSLQRAAGNAAVRHVMERPPRAVHVVGAPAVQRQGMPGTTPQVPSAPTDRGPGGIPNAPRAEVAASALDKIKAIAGENEGEGNLWVGPLDEMELGDLWGSFGLGLPDMVDKHPKLWERSKERGMEMSDIPLTARVRQMFESEVKKAATEYLAKNETDVANVQKELGFDKAGPATPEQIEKQKDLEFMAIQAAELKKTKQRIEDAAYVGWAKQPDTPVPANDPHANAYPVPFVAGSPPPLGPDGIPKPKPDDKPMVPYEEVMAQWKPISGALIALLDQHPALYAADLAGNLGKLSGDSKDDNPVQAAREALGNLKQSITKTKDDPPEWHKLKPIHRQLMTGGRKSGPLEWDRTYYKEAMQAEIGTIETWEAVEDFGISILAATAFIIAELASGGTATVFLIAGLGLSAGQTAMKWDNWSELKNAAGSAASSSTALVDQDQADSALIDAILQTAFSVLDAWQAMKTGAKLAGAYLATRAGAKAAETGLENFAKLKPWEQLPAVEKGISELGVEGTMRKVGYEDPLKLLDHLPKGSPAAERVLKYVDMAKKLGKVDLGTALKDLGKVIAERGLTEADQIVQLAIEQLGPLETLSRSGGWSKLASALGTESKAGKQLLAWRDAIYADLKRYVTEDLGATVKETGTMGSFTNDLDMSFLGKDAAANRTKALQFLASRSGLAANAGALDKMLYIGLFTDPTRMHMFDKFPELAADLSKSAASFEEQLIWSAERARLAKSNPARAERVLAQMQELGIKPIENFEALSEKAADVLSADQDRLMGEIKALLEKEPADLAAAKPKMQELAQTQAQINVHERGGYFSGGGVRRFVTEDPKAPFPGYEPGSAPAKQGSQEYMAATDQVAKLREALEKVHNVDLASPNAMIELPGSIKSVAKYGNRFTQVAERLGLKVPGGEAFQQMANEFERILNMARGKADVTLQAALKADAEKVLAQLETACTTFDNIHVAILRELRTQAGVLGRDAVAADIVKATVARYQWLRFKEVLLASAGSIGKSITTLAMSDTPDAVPPASGAQRSAVEPKPGVTLTRETSADRRAVAHPPPRITTSSRPVVSRQNPTGVAERDAKWEC